MGSCLRRRTGKVTQQASIADSLGGRILLSRCVNGAQDVAVQGYLQDAKELQLGIYGHVPGTLGVHGCAGALHQHHNPAATPQRLRL